ncbi:hypothetical protein M422DRAFT_243784 [Sphaerobolus stellatus SS14]|nr:hypothetical protein M422DRAFT_243784 [Sphaerobolus stellatus SS14]
MQNVKIEPASPFNPPTPVKGDQDTLITPDSVEGTPYTFEEWWGRIKQQAQVGSSVKSEDEDLLLPDTPSRSGVAGQAKELFPEAGDTEPVHNESVAELDEESVTEPDDESMAEEDSSLPAWMFLGYPIEAGEKNAITHPEINGMKSLQLAERRRQNLHISRPWVTDDQLGNIYVDKWTIRTNFFERDWALLDQYLSRAILPKAPISRGSQPFFPILQEETPYLDLDFSLNYSIFSEADTQTYLAKLRTNAQDAHQPMNPCQSEFLDVFEGLTNNLAHIP